MMDHEDDETDQSEASMRNSNADTENRPITTPKKMWVFFITN